MRRGGRVEKSTTGNYRFPLDKQFQDKGYHKEPRSFGSLRNNGARHHAGCDLYAPVGSKVYAMADGTLVDYRNFYGNTFVLIVDHGGKIFRYGEIQPPIERHGYTKDIPPEIVRKGLPFDFKQGAKIQRGQHIGYVGQLMLKNEKNGNVENYKYTMLHLEVFAGDSTGSLTQIDNKEYKHVEKRNYQRRGDLLDPTEILDKASLE